MRRSFGLFIAAYFTAVFQFTWAQTIETVEMKIAADNRILVSLEIEGQSFPAIIDTAATVFLLDSRTLEFNDTQELDSEIQVIGFDGIETFPARLAGPLKLDQLDLGSHNVAVTSRPNTIGYRSIVPLNSLPGRTIDFNFEDGLLELHSDRPVQPKTHIVERAKFELLDGLMFIPIMINGKRGKAMIDTGSMASYINSVFADAAKTKPNMEKSLELAGISNSPYRSRIVSAKRFALGSHRIERFDIAVADPPILQLLEVEQEPTMILGMDILKQFRFQIDRSTGHLVFSREIAQRRRPPKIRRGVSISETLQ